jgi:hypothetical protein
MTNITEAFTLLGIVNQMVDPLALNVGLPEIYQNLTLSNFVYAKANVDSKTMIINLCQQSLQSNNNNLIYNFRLDDSDTILYNYFTPVYTISKSNTLTNLGCMDSYGIRQAK